MHVIIYDLVLNQVLVVRVKFLVFVCCKISVCFLRLFIIIFIIFCDASTKNSFVIFFFYIVTFFSSVSGLELRFSSCD
jgi:hypothetical protein